MTNRIKTTLRLPESLHNRFDEGNMNAEIVARLEASFKDEWKDRLMSASGLIDSVEMPEVLRVKPAGNAHEDISRLCELITGAPVEMVVLGMDKQRHLLVCLQLPGVTLVADRSTFSLSSPGRVEDLHRLVACLDLHDLLSDCQICIQGLASGDTPHETLDRLFTAQKKNGVSGIRELSQAMNPAFVLDI